MIPIKSKCVIMMISNILNVFKLINNLFTSNSFMVCSISLYLSMFVMDVVILVTLCLIPYIVLSWNCKPPRKFDKACKIKIDRKYTFPCKLIPFIIANSRVNLWKFIVCLNKKHHLPLASIFLISGLN